jgi:cell division protein FtsZ
MVDEKLDDQVWVTVVATRYGTPKPQPRRDLQEPTGEPRIQRRTPPPASSTREGRPERRPAFSDIDIPEFVPRR